MGELSPDKKRAYEMIAEGRTIIDVAKALGIDRKTVNRWMCEDPDLVGKIHTSVRAHAVSERPKNLEALIDLRDSDPSSMVRLRAIQLLEAQAGVVVEKQNGLPTVVIVGGQQVNVGLLKGIEFDELIKAASRRCGPDMEKVVDAVISPTGAPGADRAGVSRGAEKADAGTPGDPPGTTA